MNIAHNHGDDSTKVHLNNANQNNNLKISPKITPVIFEGKTKEYFGIWIVNLLLSIVTLGIYSAWAKVRRKKYFYHNTLIENVGFDYHAKPISILKGRLIAVALIIVASVNPILQSLVLVLIFLFLPWLVVRGSIFNARNSSHRGLRFDFTGTFGKAIRVFIGLPLLTMISLGLAVPYAAHEKNQFIVNNHRFGLSQFEMKRVVGGFYKVYLILVIVPLIGILAAIAIPAYLGYVNKAKTINKVNISQSKPSQSRVSLPFNVAAFAPVNQVNIQPSTILDDKKGVIVDEPKIKLEPVIEKIERVYSEANLNPAKQTPAETATEKAQELTVAAQPVESVNQINEQLEVESQDKILEQDLQKIEEKMEQSEYAKGQAPSQKKNVELSTEQKMQEWLQNPGILIAMLGGVMAYALFIFGTFGYLQARIGNLIWNNTTLDKLSFASNLRARDFAWIYFSNIVAIMLTIGLATPWAQIRLARYRASKLNIVGDVDFDQFVGDKKAEIKATGEEIAEIFDVDLSFG